MNVRCAFLAAGVLVVCGLASAATSTTTTTTAAPASTQVIESFHVLSDIRYRFATTQMVSVVRNTADHAQEITFDVTLPKEAFIVAFSMAIDGKIYDGEVKEKSEAKKTYQAAVDKGQSAGHVRQTPRHSNLFDVSVNVANGSVVNFTLTYQEMLKRKLGVYEHEIHVDPGQKVEDFLIEVSIQENKALKFVRTPALRTSSLMTNQVEDENPLTAVDRPTPESAYIMFEPSLSEQGDGGVSARFVVQYDVEHSPVGDVLMVDGYFVHFYAPDLPSLPKDVLFVLDLSGSMMNQKLEQLKAAMDVILGDLSPTDRFGIITFSSRATKWRHELLLATPSAVDDAKNFVKNMRADGMTNIDQALGEAVKEIKARKNTERVPVIFFLTDGIPTAGITDSNAIAKRVYDANGQEAAIVGLAFGTGADYDSLKTLCAQNSGFARKIYEASDAALQVSSLYKEISSVAAKGIKFDYLPTAVDKYTITQTEFPIVFNGTEIVICGMLRQNAENVEVKMVGEQSSGDIDVVIKYDDTNSLTLDDTEETNRFFSTSRDFASIVEKMWAYTTIKQLLREKDKVASNEEMVQSLKDKILKMSLKYKFVTPLTSMVVTKPDTKDAQIESNLKDVDDISPPVAAHGLAYSGLAMPLPRPARAKIAHRRVMGQPGSFSPRGRYHASRRRVRPSRPKLHYSRRAQVPSFHRQSAGMAGLPSFDPSSRHGSYAYPPNPPQTRTATTTTTTTTRANTWQTKRITTASPPITVSSTTATGTSLPKTRSTRKPRIVRPRPGSKKPIKKKDVYLSTVAVFSKNTDSSACVALKKIKPGKYVLLAADNTTLSIQTGCVKACRVPKLYNITFEHEGKRLVVLASRKRRWTFSSGSGFTQSYPNRNTLVISAGDVEVTLRKWSKFFSVEVRLNESQESSGILGHLMNLRKGAIKRLKRKKTPKPCKKLNTNISALYPKKWAKRFMFA